MKNTMRKFSKCFLLAACMLSVMACDKSGKNAPDFVDTRKWDEIVFDNVDRTSDFDEFTFEGPNGFSCTCVDKKNLMTREENSSIFGTSTQNRTYHYRLKSNSRYSYFKFTIPEDGFFRFAARTQNKEDETRTVVIEQNDNTLLTQIIKESDRVMLSADKACYPYYYVQVKAGTLILSYPVNPIVFYSFSFSANSNQSGSTTPGGGANPGGGSNSEQQDEVAIIINEHVSSTVDYRDFSWWVDINTTLANVFSSSSIKYGIECGYNGYDYQQYAEGKGSSYSLRSCLFIDEEDSPYKEEAHWWSLFLEMESKVKNNTYNGTEMSAYNYIYSIFFDSEYAAEKQYCGRVFVEIDGKRYYIQNFGNTPSSGNESGGNSGNEGGDDDDDDGNGGSSGGGSSETEGVTDIYLSDYTQYTNKIKVVYRFYSDERVTSAKVYYGEYSASRSVSATIIGSTINATVSGLQKGTTYYFKASATTSKGTVYSDETRLMTFY